MAARTPSTGRTAHARIHAVYRAARSTVLLPIIERLWLRAGPWLNIMCEEATLGMGLDHHAEIIDALVKGDGERAKRAVATDISDAADIMLRAAIGLNGSEARSGHPRLGELARRRVARA